MGNKIEEKRSVKLWEIICYHNYWFRLSLLVIKYDLPNV